DRDIVMAALSAGANGYCTKDIETERLAEVIRAVEDGAAWIDPAIAQVAYEIFSNVRAVNPNHSGKEYIQSILTDREYEILKLIAEGHNNQDIADKLYVSIHTIKAQVSSVLEKLQVNDRVQAAVKAVKEGVV